MTTTKKEELLAELKACYETAQRRFEHPEEGDDTWDLRRERDRAQEHYACRNALDSWIDEDTGKLIVYAWPGGYPIIYLDKDNSVLCPVCANAAMEDENEFERMRPTCGSLYEEGPTIECDGGCGTMIESAYGDPDEDDEKEEGAEERAD